MWKNQNGYSEEDPNGLEFQLYICHSCIFVSSLTSTAATILSYGFKVITSTLALLFSSISRFKI